MTRKNGHSAGKQGLRLGFRPPGICLWLAQVGTLSIIGMMTTVVVESGILPAQAAVLANWRFDPAVNQLEVTLQDQTTPEYFVLAHPPRIVLDLPNTTLGKVATQQNYSGVVRQVRVSQFQPDVTRIVLELTPEVILAIGQMQLERVKPPSGKGDRWLLHPGITAQSTPNQTQNPSPGASKPPSDAVSVPPLAQLPVNTLTPPIGTLPSAILPPATFGSQQPAIVTVPPLISPNVNPGESRPSTASSPPNSNPVISFGQPLPIATPEATNQPQTLPVLQSSTPVLPQETYKNSITTATPPVVVPTLDSTSAAGTTTTSADRQPSDILLAADSQLSLRYAGDSALSLKAGSSQPAELVLEEDLRSPTGSLIAPANTRVIGRFATNGDGSRFIAQALALPERNLPLAAKSDILKDNQTASKPITLEPGQILRIRLTEDLRQF